MLDFTRSRGITRTPPSQTLGIYFSHNSSLSCVIDQPRIQYEVSTIFIPVADENPRCGVVK